MPSLFETIESLFETRDLYEALGFTKLEKNDDRKNVTEAQIKKAYHKSSLKYHPDRTAEEDRKEATKKFQALGASYKILSDPSSRALYDESGEIDEDNGDFDDKGDWAEYWRLLFQKVSMLHLTHLGGLIKFQNLNPPP
jgi:DnaJ family protein C protein 9